MSTKQQAMAKRILESINAENAPAALHMSTWIQVMNPYVEPDQAIALIDNETNPPPCGTTMCLAGWGAFLEGWKLNPVTSQAYKDGASEPISLVGYWALDLEDDALFYTDNDVAMACLKRMAEGETYNVDMLLQEEEKDGYDDDESDED